MAKYAPPSERLLRAQESSLSRDQRVDTLQMRAVKAKLPSLDLAENLLSARVLLTIEGASTLTLSLHDPGRRLERSGLLDRDRNGRFDATVVAVDSLRFRLASVARNSPTTMELTFEDEVWALLRAHRSPLSVSRGAMTRAEFILKMIREVKVRDIPWFIPEKGKRQPREEPDLPSTRPGRGETGFDKDASFTIRGARADSQQKREVATAMGVADQEDVPQEGVVRLALLVGGIGESEFRAVMNRGGSPYGGVYQGKAKERGGPWDIRDTEGMTRSFLRGGKGFQAGGAIAAHRAHPDWSPGEIALNVEGSQSNFPSYAAGVAHYQSHVDEARKIMGLWNGGDGGATTHEAVRYKGYAFHRGQPGEPENSAQAAVRLAEEVKWRFFVMGGGAYFVNDYYLLTYAADLVLEGYDAPGLMGYPTYHWDHRQLAADVTLPVAANAWGVRPGSIVALRDMGSPLDGRWIVESFEFDLLNALEGEVTLTKPIKPGKEPAPEVFTVSVGDDTPAGGGSGGAKKAIAWANSRIGHFAEEFGQNRGDELDALERKFGMVGQPWCAIFATTALVMGGVSRECRTAAVAQIDAWAKAGIRGYQRGYRATPQPGDLMLFNPPNPDDHVALVEKVSGNSVHTIEGNTSANKVARGTRSKGSGVFVRPDYPEE